MIRVMHDRTVSDHGPSHPCNAGAQHVGVSSTRQALFAPSAKRRAMFGESHEGRRGGGGKGAQRVSGSQIDGVYLKVHFLRHLSAPPFAFLASYSAPHHGGWWGK